MKTLRNQVKKGMAFLLVAVMTVSSLPLAPKSMAMVQAADDTEKNAPSVTAFATKEELMTVFTPKDDGTATTIGKIVFGKDSSGNPLEWYILGKDSGVEGDNIAIFTASPITKDLAFESDWENNKKYESSFGTYANNPEIVYPNHYGASDLRATLQGMLRDNDKKIVTTYFTATEQSLMQATTVTTYDTKNKANYTISDVLYTLTAGGYAYNKTIKAGSKDDIILAMSTYWSNSSDNWIWLRSPYDVYNNEYAFASIPGYYVYIHYVNVENSVRPASNLNLSSVIFASAATAATSDTVVSETIAEGTAMTLRVDGSNKTIGNVVYNSSKGVILATKDGSQAGKVSLVVQGNNGEKDWYYSKAIDGIEEIKADAIKTALSNAGITVSDISLADCKIWLEITEDNVTYAKLGTEEKTAEGSGDTAISVEGSGDTAISTQGSEDITLSVAESEQKITQTNTDKKDPEGSAFYQLRLKATGKNKSVKLSWTKVKGADGYIIYGAKCGNKMKKLKTISASKKTYNVKKLKKGTYYKYIVSAYKLVDGEKRVIATSKSAHAVTTGGKYSNPTKVTYSKSKITLKKGKTKTLKPKLKYSKKLKTHIAKFRYESTDTSVATVNKNGKITAKKKGNCYVYIYAQNGVYKKITVKVN